MGVIDVVRSKLEWTSQEFWAEAGPALTIDGAGQAKLHGPVETGRAGDPALRELTRTEGYFQLPPPDWQLPLATMAELVGTLERRGIPVAFAFVYDEFWALSLKLTPLIETVLGPGFLRLPDFWVWHVDPVKDERGWRPHRDKGYQALRSDGYPKSLTVWLPLSDANTLNGCMYLLPADRDPTYGTADDKQWKVDLPDVRALPADAGSILAWNQAVLHWGSHGSPRETRPRVSVAFEYQAGDIPPYNQPLMTPETVPDFDGRLKLIAKQILQYQHMYPLSDEVKAIAEGIGTL